jgi:hypothetical protein
MPDKNYLPNCGKNCTRCWRKKNNFLNKIFGIFQEFQMEIVPKMKIIVLMTTQIKTRDDFPS